MNNRVGIDKIGLFVPNNYLDMRDLAEARGIEADKLLVGIGQEQMAVPTIIEDVVSMAANAAAQILDDEDKASIDQIIFGTESSQDFSKSSATYLHELLGIQPFAKSFEIKQACYGATAGLQMACDYIRLRPDRKVLVIASDVARYGLKTSGEPTQGAGAVAMLISANPRVMTIDQESISLTSNQFDFWRPSYSDVALVDGKFSTELYQKVFTSIARRAEETMLEKWMNLESIIFHLPFTKMGKKALDAYEVSEPTNIHKNEKKLLVNRWRENYQKSITLNRRVGNIYTGSMFLSLLSYLSSNQAHAENQSIGLFSYGSGAVAELVMGTIQENYLDMINFDKIRSELDERRQLSISKYEEIFNDSIQLIEGNFLPKEFPKKSGFYLEHIDGHRRFYKYYE